MKPITELVCSWIAVRAYACIALSSFAVGCTDNEEMSRLMLAAYSGDLEGVRTEIARSDGINLTSSYGWTALMFAAHQGHSEVVRVLLSAGADPNIESGVVPSDIETVGSYPPTTALRAAIRAGHLSIAKMLVEHGSNADAEAVALGAGNGSIEFLMFLKNHNADFNTASRNAFAASPLCAAAARGRTEVLSWLLDQGADPNMVAFGQLPLGEAVGSVELECVRILLDRGADANINFGVSDECPLFKAVTCHTPAHLREQHLQIIRLLLEHGADPTRRVWHGKSSPLKMAKGYAQRGSGETERSERQEGYDEHHLAVLAMLE